MSLDLSESATEPFLNSYKKLSDKSAPNNWMAMSIGDNKLVANGEGTGGWNDLRAAFKDDSVNFGIIKVQAVDEQNSVRDKYIFITYVGSGVSVLKKARVSVQKDGVSKLFGGIGCFVDFDHEDLESGVKTITQKLIASGGAHKPNFYDFGGGVKQTCDFHDA